MKRISLKTYMAGLLIILAIIGGFQQGFKDVAIQLVLTVAAAVILDLAINWVKIKKIIFPSSAFITGMIIALVLSPNSNLYIPVCASVAAISQKYIISYKGKHIFNPANLGLLFSIFVFNASAAWWGQSFWPLIILAGIFICYKMKRIQLPLIFIIVSVIANTLFAGVLLMDAITTINIFFIFIMLIEPITSPVTKKGLIIYPVLVAFFSSIFFRLIPQYDFSILALAAGNITVPFLNRLK